MNLLQYTRNGMPGKICGFIWQEKPLSVYFVVHEHSRRASRISQRQEKPPKQDPGLLELKGGMVGFVSNVIAPNMGSYVKHQISPWGVVMEPRDSIGWPV
jgi:hypothetical protein